MNDVNDLTDEKLMEEYKNGSEIAFTILYQKHFFEENKSDKIDLMIAPEAQGQSGTLPLEPFASRLPNFDSLSESQREVLELRYHNELSFEEIAKKLKITPLNVRQITSRAIKKL